MGGRDPMIRPTAGPHIAKKHTQSKKAEVTSLAREKGRLLDRVAALEGRLARAEEGLEEEGQRREVSPWWSGVGDWWGLIGTMIRFSFFPL